MIAFVHERCFERRVANLKAFTPSAPERSSVA